MLWNYEWLHIRFSPRQRPVLPESVERSLGLPSCFNLFYDMCFYYLFSSRNMSCTLCEINISCIWVCISIYISSNFEYPQNLSYNCQIFSLLQKRRILSIPNAFFACGFVFFPELFMCILPCAVLDYAESKWLDKDDQSININLPSHINRSQREEDTTKEYTKCDANGNNYQYT